MRPIKAVDAAFLQLETDATPMHVGALYVLEPRTAREGKTFFRRFRNEIAHCLGGSEIFTRRVVRPPLAFANPMWAETGDVDLDYHVHRTVLPPPGSQHQLEECVADLHAPRMDTRRPLWELHVIEGLERGRVALYVKTHHAGLDGASAQVFLMSFVDAGKPAPAGARRRAPLPPRGEAPTTGQLLEATITHQVRQIASLPALAATLGGSVGGSLRDLSMAVASLTRGGTSAPHTPLNVAITGERSFASVDCELAAVKSIARTHGTTVNDVVLAACAGTLRNWLQLHDALPDQPLRSAVPVSIRDAGNSDHSIQVSFMSVDLHTDLADPHARLAAIHRSAREAKHSAAKLRPIIPEDLPSLGLPWLLGGLARVLAIPGLLERVPLPTNVIISNVAGPPVPLFVARARALTYSPVSIPYHGCALNVTVYSYDGKLFFGLTGARSVLPDLRDLADGVRAEIDALMKPARKGRHRRRR